MTITRRQALLVPAAAALAATTLTGGPAAAYKRPEIYIRKGGIFQSAWTHAIGGFDAVAYQDLAADAAPVAGKPEFETTYKDAKWLFASQENLDKFTADPDKYRPQYGGYCAWAVANYRIAEGDPEVWALHEGKLYLNVNRSIQKDWLSDKEGYITKAEGNWPKVLDK